MKTHNMQSVLKYDVATCMYYTGVDAVSKKGVYVAGNHRPQDAVIDGCG